MPLVSKAFGDIITFTRASTATYFDATGTLQSAAINTPRFDYDPATLAARGFLIEEARTNHIRNNTMQGAVASVARNIGTISSVSRSASATVVVAATGHTVSLGDVITVSGATPSVYNGTYSVSAVVANVSYSYVVASSATDSASGYAVSVMSPGTLPTNWPAGSQAGLSREIVGVGTTNGITYIDVRYFGTTTSTFASIPIEVNNFIVAANGQTWTNSAWLGIVAGTTTNITSLNLATRFNDSGGAQLTFDGNNFLSTSSTFERVTNTFTAANASTAFISSLITLGLNNSSAVDFTLRIGLPQLEGGLGSSVNSGTASGTTTAVVLSAGSATDDIYNGNSLFVNGQYRVITDYVGSTKTATVSPALSVSPSGSYTVFAVGNAAFATSVIPTSGSALTRAADVASVNTLSPWFNSTEYTLYWEGAVSSTGAVLGGIGDTFSNTAYLTSGASAQQFSVLSGGSAQTAPLNAAYSFSSGVPYKVAATTKENDFNICVNGGSVANDNSGLVPASSVRMGIGNAPWSAGGGNQRQQWIRRITYYPRRLSNAELQSITA